MLRRGDRYARGWRARFALAALAVVLTGCGIAKPWQEVPSAAGSKHILLLGDALLSQAAHDVDTALDFAGVDANVVDRTTPGLGLLGPGIVTQLTAQLDANPDTDIVVVEFTGDCQSCPVPTGSPEYFQQWLVNAQQLIDAITNRGMVPVWVVAPPIDPALANASSMQSIAQQGLALAQSNQAVVSNWSDALTDIFGAYQDTLLYAGLFEDATLHVVRFFGTFLTEDGIQRVANWTAAAIRQAWDVPPPAPPTSLEVSATPALFPVFAPDVTDYVIRCTGDPVAVRIGAPTGTTVSVAGEPGGSGRFTAFTTRTTGQSFTISVQAQGQPAADYHVRCLPTDFPMWSVSRTGSTQAEYYVTVPWTSDPTGNYPAIFDDDGVPIWWAPKSVTLFDELLPNGHMAWTGRSGPSTETTLDGSVVANPTTPNLTPDEHDLLRLANGNYVMVGNYLRPNTDFSSWTGTNTTGTLIDHVLEEITPGGGVVWSWDVGDHIPVSETDPQWRAPNVAGLYDAYHFNSVEAAGTGFVLSFRHLDAVYDVDPASGNIVWKLGGSPRPESLTILDDPVFDGGSHLGGQHDARVLADGTVTLHDNGTGLGRPPRGVRYQIDTGAHTATWLEQSGDGDLVASVGCCGSARRLTGGDWVFGWGGTNTVTERTSGGQRVFLMQFVGANVYRATPVLPGVLDRATLRAGMDAQYPPS
ncbi:MAG TPA: aryl-sulfate sulfotransferase [Acidimicrobiia bacterium]